MGIYRRRLAFLLSGFGSMCCCAAPAAGAGTDDCRAMTKDAQRLACYDQLFPRPVPSASTASTPGAAVTAPLASAVSPAPTAAQGSEGAKSDEAPQQFGLTPAQQRAAAGGTERAKTTEQISATVTALQHEPGGEFVVFLDNGQVWRQSEPDWWSPPQKGDRVTIRRGLLGSFMLVPAGHLATHVRRLR